MNGKITHLAVLLSLTTISFTASAVSAPETLETIVANTISNNDRTAIENLLSELEPKVTTVCEIESPKCAMYTTYVADLTAALNGSTEESEVQ